MPPRSASAASSARRADTYNTVSLSETIQAHRRRAPGYDFGGGCDIDTPTQVLRLDIADYLLFRLSDDARCWVVPGGSARMAGSPNSPHPIFLKNTNTPSTVTPTHHSVTHTFGKGLTFLATRINHLIKSVR